MGNPKKARKKYSTPSHPWQKFRIDDEKALIREYGLKNKKEIWKISSKVKGFSRQAKNLIARTNPQGEKERNQLIMRLNRLGLLSKEANLDDVLGLKTRDLMDRRLQAMVLKKGLARSMRQARQFIVHQHIMVSGKKITAPNYLVKMGEENEITFAPISQLSDPDHPEREIKDAMPKKKKVDKK